MTLSLLVVTVISSLKQFRHAIFKMKDLEALNYFLGKGILQEARGVSLTQRTFAKVIIHEFNYETYFLSLLPLYSYETHP